MAATFAWCEDNGASTGSPVAGTTRSGFGADTHNPTDVNWKNIDNNTTAVGGTAYTANPIVAGNNSFTKFQYGRFSGTYNQILNAKWSAHTSPVGALAAGLTLHGKVQTLYTTPATTTDSGMSSATDFTTAVAIGSGTAVSFAVAGPETASPTATLAAGGGYTQYLSTQLITTVSAAAGDMAAITTTLQYDEN